MDEQEYMRTQASLMTLCQLLHSFNLDLRRFIRMIDHADAVGPILDPSLWMQGHSKMSEIREIALAFLNVQGVLQDILARNAAAKGGDEDG